MDRNAKKAKLQANRKRRVRKKIVGIPERPRLCVRKSLKHVYAQIVDDVGARSLVQVSTLSKTYKEQSEASGTKAEKGKRVGNLIAERALEKGIKTVVFDRGGFQYHGRVRAVAEGAREKGLVF